MERNSLFLTLKLQKFHLKNNNMPYKKYSPAQKKLAAVAYPRKKITEADFKALKKRRG